MNDRLRAVATSVATLALFVFGTAIFPSATASAQSSDFGSAGPAPAPALTGINNFDCRSEQHPRPVVLVHGTDMSMEESWQSLNEALKRDNYCVFALNYGWARSASRTDPFGLPGPYAWGHAAIEDSAKELSKFIEDVRTRTGAAKVDVVGHSQGGTMTRQYLKFEGGADQANPANNKVHTLAMLGPSTHGTNFGGVYMTEAEARDDGASIAGQQQIIGSTFLTTLNAGQETFPGIDYTVIASNTDKIITPHTSSALIAAPGTSVLNMYVQDKCPGLAISHANETNGLLSHPAPVFLVRQALDPTLQGTVPC